MVRCEIHVAVNPPNVEAEVRYYSDGSSRFYKNYESSNQARINLSVINLSVTIILKRIKAMDE
jgi:hypothetical protein